VVPLLWLMNPGNHQRHAIEVGGIRREFFSNAVPFGDLIHEKAEKYDVDPALDIMADVKDFFARSLEIAARAGIARDRIVLDPGVGFGKTPEQSIETIARLAELRAFGLPLLIGLSRKRFIDSVSPSKPQQRIGGSIAANVLAVLRGAGIVRVHDVAETVQALRVVAAIQSHG